MLSGIGRENEQEIDDGNLLEFGGFIDSDLDQNKINRKILDLNEITFDDIPKNLFSKRKVDPDKKYTKIPEGMLWHIRLGHASLDYLRKLQKRDPILENVKFDDSIRDCEVCILSKMEKLPFKEVRTRAENVLQRIHTDMMGPITPRSYPSGFKYILTFVDDYSRFAKIYSIGKKSQASECLERYLQYSRNLIGENKKVCYIRADNAKEYLYGGFLDIMNKEKIDNDFSPPHTAPLNGTSERINKTLEGKIRSLLIDSGLPLSMWPLAAEASVHIYNRTPHKSNEFKTPLELFAPNLKHHINKLRRFGCISYIKIPNPETKFSPVAIKAVLVGFSSTGYICWHPQTGRFLNSKHVHFNEKMVYKDEFSDIKITDEIENYSESESDEEMIEEHNQLNKNNIQALDNLDSDPDFQIINLEKEITKKQNNPLKRKPVRSSKDSIQITPRKLPMRKAKEGRDFTIYAKNLDIENQIEDISFAFYTAISLDKQKIFFKDCNVVYSNNVDNDIENEIDEMIYLMFARINKDPTSVKEALSSENSKNWKEAISDELESMETNKVWTIVDRPSNKEDEAKMNIVDSKWVFSRKTGSDNKITHKARLVVRGFKDKNEYELKEIYSPVARLSLIRAVLAIVNKYNLELHQMDVKTAFLNGELDKDIYMKIPEGVEGDPEVRNKKLLKLLRTIYGIKISSNKWNEKLSFEVAKLGLEREVNEPCLFTWRKEGKIVFMLLYVDDMLIGGNFPEKILEIKTRLSSIFRMKDLGEPRLFLGMEIKRDRENQILTITQTEYVEKVLERFKMQECNPQKSPMVTSQVQKRKLTKNLENTPKIPFREAIGSLLYLAGGTRPDISFAVNILSRRQTCPTYEDWEDVKRIFRYIRGTSKMGLTFKGRKESLEAVTDASFLDWNDGTSTSGYVIKLYNDTVAWRSHKQSQITTSTCEAEYLAISEVCDQLISLDKGLRDILGTTFYPMTIWCDNKSAVKNTEMDGSNKLKAFDYEPDEVRENLRFREINGKKKPIGLHHADCIKVLVKQNKCKIKWVSSKENIADIMTKPLEFRKHNELRDRILNVE